MCDQPVSIRALREPGVLEIGWRDGTEARVPFKTLRAHCPCAGCVDELTGLRILDINTIPADIAPTKLDLSGNYALKIEWNDGHATGLFTWRRLAEIAKIASSSHDVRS